MNKAIIICYTGRQIRETERVAIENIISEACDATQNLIMIKRFDENDIANALLKESAKDQKVLDHDAPASKICITFNPETCEEKLQVVKWIKESIGCSLKDARDMFDCGKVYIPKLWSDHTIYKFIENLCACNVTITSGMEDVAMVQAAIFLNKTYSRKDSIALVKDFAAAAYHSHTNSADEEEQALLTAVELVKNNPTSAARWVSSELINVITSL